MMNFGNEARDLREPVRPASPPSAVPAGPAAPAAHASPQNKVAVLGPTLRFKGELSAEEDFVLQGSLEGSINNPQCVTVGTEGSVIGDIRARIVTIDGQVEGDLYGTESVVVHQSGRVTGNIFAPRVGIVEGAYFNGRVDMSHKPAADKPVTEKSAADKASQAAGRVPSHIAPGVALSPEETEKVLGVK